MTNATATTAPANPARERLAMALMACYTEVRNARTDLARAEADLRQQPSYRPLAAAVDIARTTLAAAVARRDATAEALDGFDAAEARVADYEPIDLDSSAWRIVDAMHGSCDSCRRAAESAAIHARAMGSRGGRWQDTTCTDADGITVHHEAHVERVKA